LVGKSLQKFMIHKPLPVLVALVQLASIATAYPPAPSIVINGLIKDTFGDRWSIGNSEVVLFSGTQEYVSAPIVINYTLDTNYQLTVPFDSGLRGTSYRPTALKPYTDITLKVRSGAQVYLPIEMTAPIQLEKAGALLTINLTLGEDSDKDGLPDLWEEWQLSDLGIYRGDPNFSLSLIDPNGDNDNDGLSNYNEYIAGTYAMDQQDGLELVITQMIESQKLVEMEFLGIKGRVYSIEASADLKTWIVVNFRPMTTGASAVASYGCDDVKIVMAYVPKDAGEYYYYRLKVK
jgi:hypothetical protein